MFGNKFAIHKMDLHVEERRPKMAPLDFVAKSIMLVNEL